jgi:hypothetical protein
MRILKGVSSRFLPCGCLAGVYETYDGEIVTIVDARGASCTHSSHSEGNVLPEEQPLKSTSSARRSTKDHRD